MSLDKYFEKSELIPAIVVDKNNNEVLIKFDYISDYSGKDSLVIRNANVNDALILCNWWNDGKIMAHAGFPNGLNTTEQDVLNSIKNDSDRNHLLILEINHIPVGEMCFHNVEESVVAIGIKICDCNQQEKGYGT